MGRPCRFGTDHRYDIYDANDNERDIHDLYMAGEDCNGPRIQRCHKYGEDISQQLTEEEKWVVNAIGKTYWGIRVHSSDPPEAHPQYKDTIDTEIDKSVQQLQKISDPRLQRLAYRLMEELSVSLPSAQSAA